MTYGVTPDGFVLKPIANTARRPKYNRRQHDLIREG